MAKFLLGLPELSRLLPGLPGLRGPPGPDYPDGPDCPDYPDYPDCPDCPDCRDCPEFLGAQRLVLFSVTVVWLDGNSAPRGVKHALTFTSRRAAFQWRKLSAIFIVVNCQNKIDKSAATCASQWRPASLSAMTHVRWSRGQSGRQSTDCTVCGFFVLVGSELGASTCAQTKTRAMVNVRPLVNQQASKQQLRTKDTIRQAQTQAYTFTDDTWHKFCSTLAPIILLEDGVCGLTKIMLGLATRTTQSASGCALAHVKNLRVVTRSRKTKNRLTCGPCCVREIRPVLFSSQNHYSNNHTTKKTPN